MRNVITSILLLASVFSAGSVYAAGAQFVPASCASDLEKNYGYSKAESFCTCVNDEVVRRSGGSPTEYLEKKDRFLRDAFEACKHKLN